MRPVQSLAQWTPVTLSPGSEQPLTRMMLLASSPRLLFSFMACCLEKGHLKIISYGETRSLDLVQSSGLVT